MIYDSKAVTEEELRSVLRYFHLRYTENWERLPDPNDPSKPLDAINGVIYLRRPYEQP